MPKVAYITHSSPEVIELVSSFAPPGYEVIGMHHSVSEGEKIEATKDADFIILHSGRLSDALLKGVTKLKMLQLLSAGFDNVNLPFMAELGIPVANVGGANRQVSCKKRGMRTNVSLQTVDGECGSKPTAPRTCSPTRRPS